tara:strand:+ start:154 stop:1137 length:984 start_codon:yes stop_codon:yes gene_type:complete
MTSKKRPLPPVVRIEPASACNLKCSHCPTGVFEMARTIMKPEVFERCLEEVKKHMPPLRVCSLYQGGEPFLNKHFMSMIPRVKALGFPLVKTVSNGMLIKPEMCDDIITSGLDELEISMDGHSPEENDRVRINSRFEHLNMILHKLVEANRRLGGRVKMVISSTQFMSFDDQKLDEPAGAPDYLRDAFADIINDIHFKPTWARVWPSALPAEGYDLLHDDRPHVPPGHCDILDDMLNIRADGRVVACCYDLTSTTNFGNIMESSIQEIWDGLPSVSFRDGYESGNFPELCQNCMVVTGPKYLLHKDSDRPRVIHRVSDRQRQETAAE